MRSLIIFSLILFLCGCDPEKKSRAKIESLEQAGENQRYALGIACMQYISQNGKDLAYSKTLIKKLFRAGFFPEAIYAAELLLRKFPHDAELFYLRGIAYRRQHQYGLAMEDLQYAVQLSPANSEFSQETMSLKREHDLWKEIELLNESLPGTSDSFSILLNRAEKLFDIQQYDAVLYDLGALSKMRSPEDSIYYTERVTALYKDNRRPVDRLSLYNAVTLSV
jgi:tetratricopeptide (TPR) repeat protein